MKRIALWLAGVLASLFCLLPFAQAQTASDYTQGVDVSGNVATIWFKPTSSTTSWVDVHYKLNGGAQQNLRMTWNASTGRHETQVTPVANGNTLAYNYTYNKGTAAYDSASFNFTVGQSTGGGGGGGDSGSGSGYTYGVSVSGNTATVWFKPTGSLSFVDLHYTLNGGGQQNFRMANNTSAGRYETNVSPVASGNVLAYWYTFSTNGSTQTDTPHYSYTVGSGTTNPGTVATPTFSPAPGTYSSAQNVTISTTTSGATIKYTTDGSTPTSSSATYSGAISVASSKTLKAIAQKSGMTDSAVATAAYTIQTGGTWNGMTTFNMVNQTNGRWADNQVYWSIIGKDWNTGQFVHVDLNGNLIPMSTADNGALTKNGVTYTNYFYTLAQSKSITIPAINSARILFSVGSPMYIRVVIDGNGNVGYAGANIENPSDPNIDVYFDFGEMAIIPKGKPDQGIFVNTTRVDQFGFPVKLRVQGLNGFDQSVGEPMTESRDTLFTKFQSETPAEFHGLAQAPYSPYRIMAPSHATFIAGKANANYLQSYIDSVWTRYRSEELVFTLDTMGTFRGRVSGDRFIFTGGNKNGTYYINGKPTTSMVFLGNGLLDDTSGGPTDTGVQLQIQAQLCAALNRHVAETPANWYVQSAHHPAGLPSNWFSKFWHDHSINKLAYGFAYDDVGGFSPSIHTDSPTTVTFTIGW